MSSRAGSTILTFLVSIPVAAAGLVAVFGIPPFSNLSNVLAGPRGFSEFDREDEGRRSRRTTDRNADEWGDPVDAPEWEADQDTVDLGEDSRETRDHQDALGFSEEGVGSDRSREPERQSLFSSQKKDSSTSRSSFEETSDEEAPQLSSRTAARDRLLPKRGFADVGSLTSRESETSPPTSMKEALKKLNMLDVKTYHLKPGVEPDTWLFVCLFTPGDDARVVQRFEAEEADPDLAVNEVLKQIDAWLAQRWKDKQPVARNAR